MAANVDKTLTESGRCGIHWSSNVMSRYCIASDVYFRRLDHEMVVYLTGCFETHLLDDVGGQVVEAVQQMQEAATPCSLATLYAWMWTDANFGPAIQAELEAEAVLMPLVSELVRIGVVSPQVC